MFQYTQVSDRRCKSFSIYMCLIGDVSASVYTGVETDIREHTARERQKHVERQVVQQTDGSATPRENCREKQTMQRQ